MFYIVLEIQQVSEDSRACIPLVYTDYNLALAKMYQVLSVAATTSLPYHGCYILGSNGIVLDGRKFERPIESDIEEEIES